jgi:hypothetical protein
MFRQNQRLHIAESPTGGFEKITGTDAIATIGQQVTMEFMDRGVKIRIRGKQADCEKTAKRILKGSPTVASQQGSKYMIEATSISPFSGREPTAGSRCQRRVYQGERHGAFLHCIRREPHSCPSSLPHRLQGRHDVHDRRQRPPVRSLRDQLR